MASKKTTKRKTDQYYLSPCPVIDQMLSIKKISDREGNKLYHKLKEYIRTIPPEGAVFNYIKLLISELLIDPEILTPYLGDESSQIILKEVYECIVDIYVAFRIEIICGSINKLPLTGPIDPNSIFTFDPNAAKNPTPPPVDPVDHVRQILSSAASSAAPHTRTRRAKESQIFLNRNDLKTIESFLKKGVIGQDKAIESLVNRLKLISVGFDRRGSFFFIGRTGVGKTELARLFGKKYCGNFAKINCAEFSHGHEIAKLIGAPPGYVGSSQASFFKEKADISSRWVFLFDEVEKANEKLFNLLLSLLDDGTITDSSGHVLDFSNSIFIFTSNQGISDIKESNLGFGSKGPTQEAINETLRDSLSKKFSPEFRNRIDEFIYFNDLTPESVSKIVRLNLESYPVQITEELIKYVVDNSYSREFGAREVKRFIKNSIGLYLAGIILDGVIPIKGTDYKLKIESNKLVAVDCIKIPTKTSTIV